MFQSDSSMFSDSKIIIGDAGTMCYDSINDRGVENIRMLKNIVESTLKKGGSNKN